MGDDFLTYGINQLQRRSTVKTAGGVTSELNYTPQHTHSEYVCVWPLSAGCGCVDDWTGGL